MPTEKLVENNIRGMGPQANNVVGGTLRFWESDNVFRWIPITVFSIFIA